MGRWWGGIDRHHCLGGEWADIAGLIGDRGHKRIETVGYKNRAYDCKIKAASRNVGSRKLILKALLIGRSRIHNQGQGVTTGGIGAGEPDREGETISSFCSADTEQVSVIDHRHTRCHRFQGVDALEVEHRERGVGHRIAQGITKACTDQLETESVGSDVGLRQHGDLELTIAQGYRQDGGDHTDLQALGVDGPEITGLHIANNPFIEGHREHNSCAGHLIRGGISDGSN